MIVDEVWPHELMTNAVPTHEIYTQVGPFAYKHELLLSKCVIRILKVPYRAFWGIHAAI